MFQSFILSTFQGHGIFVRNYKIEYFLLLIGLPILISFNNIEITCVFHILLMVVLYRAQKDWVKPVLSRSSRSSLTVINRDRESSFKVDPAHFLFFK